MAAAPPATVPAAIPMDVPVLGGSFHHFLNPLPGPPELGPPELGPPELGPLELGPLELGPPVGAGSGAGSGEGIGVPGGSHSPLPVCCQPGEGAPILSPALMIMGVTATKATPVRTTAAIGALAKPTPPSTMVVNGPPAPNTIVPPPAPASTRPSPARPLGSAWVTGLFSQLAYRSRPPEVPAGSRLIQRPRLGS
jgi:hypothetical protein